ncbi:MAG: D-alanine--D-alanine ligase family protein, partial [Deltaproteobacteria bacterium]
MKTVLILCGGRSDEHEISLISAKGILDALDRKKYSPLLVGISKKGVWHLLEEHSFYLGEFRADKIKLNENFPSVTLAPFSNEKRQGSLLCHGKTHTFDVVFPILHGRFGEDGTLQGMLDMIGVPSVGSHCGSSWLCMDKILTKTLCLKAGIPTAKFTWVSRLEDLSTVQNELNSLKYPLFVKPPRQGSSVGVSKVTSPQDLTSAVETALKYDTKCLIEEGIQGREIECAVLGNHGSAKVAAPGEIIPSKKIGWYSFEAKYLLADGAETKVPTDLDPQTTEAVKNFALKAFDCLECDGMARV